MLLYEVQSTARKKTRITYEDKFACTKGYEMTKLPKAIQN